MSARTHSRARSCDAPVVRRAVTSAYPLLLLLVLPACQAAGDGLDGPVPKDANVAVLVGRLGPGVPPDGEVPGQIELVFTNEAGATVSTTARDGRYEVTLSPGTWNVRASDGKACATGLAVNGGARQRNDLAYPAGECTDAAPPPAPPAPDAPPG